MNMKEGYEGREERSKTRKKGRREGRKENKEGRKEACQGRELEKAHINLNKYSRLVHTLHPFFHPPSLPSVVYSFLATCLSSISSLPP
jgi:hypothetical protein